MTMRSKNDEASPAKLKGVVYQIWLSAVAKNNCDGDDQPGVVVSELLTGSINASVDNKIHNMMPQPAYTNKQWRDLLFGLYFR